MPRGSSASRREDTALAAHRTPWHSGEHSGLYKILFPIFACSSLVISARGHTPQASNHSVMRLLMEARRSLGSKARRTQPPRAYEYRLNTSRGRRGGGGGEEAGELGPVRSAAGGVGTPPPAAALCCWGGQTPPPSSRDELSCAGGVASRVRPLSVCIQKRILHHVTMDRNVAGCTLGCVYTPTVY